MIKFANKILREFLPHFIMLAIFFSIAIFGFFLMRTIIISNTQKLGNEIADFYAMEEEKNFISYKRFIIRLGTVINSNPTYKTDLEFLKKLFNELNASSTDDSNISPYAVINNTLVLTSDIAKYKSLNYHSRPWYKKALQANGEIIITDVYTDHIRGTDTITMAKKINDDNDVVAIDIFPQNYVHPTRSALLPSGSNYYLFDKNGHVLHYESTLGLTDSAIRRYAEKIFRNLTRDKKTTPQIILDPHGKQKFVFFSTTADKLNILVTIPNTILSEKLNNLFYITVIILCLLCFFIIFNIYKSYKTSKQYQLITDTINFLGNIYFAICLIDLNKRNVTIIKAPRKMFRNLKKNENYENFLKVTSSIMDKETAKEFLTAFSIENLLILSKQGIKEFGGDFKQIFSDKAEWISINIFFDNIISNNNAILCFKKISEEKEAQIKQYNLLITALENAQQNEKARNDFFANMSHDMRTPLNGILGFTELGINHAATLKDAKEYFHKIRNTSNHLLELINHILNLSHEENKKHTTDQTVINLKETVESCVQPFYALAITQNKHFKAEYEIQNPYIFAQPFKLTQILNNVISNAFKYSDENDSILLKVRQICSTHHTKFQFIIEDTGKGMTKEFLQKIFIPYQREILFGAKKIQGTGLGMPIVKNIITGLNGEIHIDSELGKGTSVSIVLPFTLAEKQQPTVTTISPTPNYDLSNLRILLVEDNQINMEITCKLLTVKNIQVTKAWNGREAVSLFSHSTEYFYDMILMDLQMPELDGAGATQEIRTLPRKDAKTVPIIALTANAFAEDIAHCLQIGMNDHIAKPFNPQKLYEIIHQYCQLKTDN